MKMSDIHVHSNESDGDQSVFRVALEASKCPQLQAIHISDHNHFSVLEPVKVNDRLMVYPGCEASVSLLGREQHILLLSQNALDKKLLTEFNALYKGLEEARYQHMVDTITFVNETKGFGISVEEVLGFPLVKRGRGRVAQFLAYRGYYPTTRDALDLCCGNKVEGSPKLIYDFPALKDILALAKRYELRVVLAHPTRVTSYELALETVNAFVEQCEANDISHYGIELYNNRDLGDTNRIRLEEKVRAFDIPKLAGSDRHYEDEKFVLTYREEDYKRLFEG